VGQFGSLVATQSTRRVQPAEAAAYNENPMALHGIILAEARASRLATGISR